MGHAETAAASRSRAVSRQPVVATPLHRPPFDEVRCSRAAASLRNLTCANLTYLYAPQAPTSAGGLVVQLPRETGTDSGSGSSEAARSPQRLPGSSDAGNRRTAPRLSVIRLDMERKANLSAQSTMNCGRAVAKVVGRTTGQQTSLSLLRRKATLSPSKTSRVSVQFKDQVNAIAKQLDTMNRTKRYVFDPRQSKFLGWWDVFTGVTARLASPTAYPIPAPSSPHPCAWRHTSTHAFVPRLHVSRAA